MVEYEAKHPEGQEVRGIEADRIDDTSDRIILWSGKDKVGVFPWPWAVYTCRRDTVGFNSD